MNYLLNKKFDGTFSMNFIGIEALNSIVNAKVFKPTSPVVGIKKITKFSSIIRNENDYQFTNIYFKYQNKYDNPDAKCQDCWSELLPISEITNINLLPSQAFDLELYVYRIDNPPFDNSHPRTVIFIGEDEYSPSIVIEGEYEFNWTDGPFTLNDTVTEVVLKSKDIYKIFSIRDYQVIADFPDNIEIHYRVTYDNGRSFSKWEPLNKPNISTYRFNNLRFSKIEYKIKTIYDNNQPNNIYDIILIGSFENVSANYLKTNRYGIRQDCLTTYLNPTPSGNTDTCGWNISTTTGTTDSFGTAPGNGQLTGTMSPYSLNMNFYTQGLSCYSNDNSNISGGSSQNNVISNITTENENTQIGGSTYWKPYEISKITSFANMLANQVNDIFGWEVDYHLTDPDSNGIDFILHEYQLFNISDMKKIKILVPDNKFPDNMIKFNQFSLDLFDTFEIHILKDEFKRKFGIDKRPGENDILYICPINRPYIVKHAQIFREIMNAGYYYKVILEKYEQKANVRNLNEVSKKLLEDITKNTTMEEIFEPEKTNEENKVANIEQFKPFTFDPMRYIVNNKVIRIGEDLYNGNFDFSKSHYDFSDVIGKSAVIYKKTDNVITESTNRSFICWFNFKNKWNPEKPNKNAIDFYNIDRNTNFWFLDNYDDNLKKGYRMWYFKKDINFQLNDQIYKLQNVNLLTNIWYALIINLDQRQKIVTLKIYTRDNDYNVVFFRPESYQVEAVSWLDTTGYTYMINNGYKPVSNIELKNNSTEYVGVKESTYENIYTQEFEHDCDLNIKGSNIKYTNLRILTDVIPENETFNILNQFYVDNNEKVILIDNADKNIYTTNYINKNWT